jgi:hypothetical protein
MATRLTSWIIWSETSPTLPSTSLHQPRASFLLFCHVRQGQQIKFLRCSLFNSSITFVCKPGWQSIHLRLKDLSFFGANPLFDVSLTGSPASIFRCIDSFTIFSHS